ncbi:hypothetical protein [Paracoccus sp. (in: a-proteobacteria)]|uniref:hypothetical protein n=1 Tax=Paracoccus sp. TaxID=267 RepID=UPI003A856FE2
MTTIPALAIACRRAGQALLAVDAACEAIARLSWLGHDWGEALADFEINPFRITETGAFALDGRGTVA